MCLRSSLSAKPDKGINENIWAEHGDAFQTANNRWE